MWYIDIFNIYIYMFNNNSSGGKLSILVVATAPGLRSQEVEYPALHWLSDLQPIK